MGGYYLIDFFWAFEYITTFLECFLCLCFVGAFLEKSKKQTEKNIFISIVSSVIMWLINHLQLYSVLSMIFALLLVISMSYTAYRKILRSSALSALYFLILIIIDNIVVSSVSHLTNISTSEIYKEFSVFRLIAIVASKTLLVLTVFIVRKVFSRKCTLKIKYLLLLFVSSLILMIVSVSISFLEMKSNNSNRALSAAFFVIMFILMLFIFFGTFRLSEYYDKIHELEMITMKNIMLEQSINESKQSFELMRTSLHDYKHNIVNLTVLAENNDINGIKEYLYQQNDYLSKSLFYYKTGNDIVDAMLYIKQKTAEANRIPFLITANIPSSCPVTSEHFSSILGNLIDNALEASQSEDEPYIEVKMAEMGNYFWIVVKNKCTIPNLSLVTQKKDKHIHGIGLNSVKHTVKKYDGDIYINSDNDVFEIRIMIPTM